MDAFLGAQTLVLTPQKGLFFSPKTPLLDPLWWIFAAFWACIKSGKMVLGPTREAQTRYCRKSFQVSKWSTPGGYHWTREGSKKSQKGTLPEPALGSAAGATYGQKWYPLGRPLGAPERYVLSAPSTPQYGFDTKSTPQTDQFPGSTPGYHQSLLGSQKGHFLGPK